MRNLQKNINKHGNPHFCTNSPICLPSFSSKTFETPPLPSILKKSNPSFMKVGEGGVQTMVQWYCQSQGLNEVHCDHKMRPIFPLSQCQRNFMLLFSQYKTLCKTQKNTREFHLYCDDHVCKINEWCLFGCFHHKFRVSTQFIMYSIIASWNAKSFLPVAGF